MWGCATIVANRNPTCNFSSAVICFKKNLFDKSQAWLDPAKMWETPLLSLAPSLPGCPRHPLEDVSHAGPGSCPAWWRQASSRSSMAPLPPKQPGPHSDPKACSGFLYLLLVPLNLPALPFCSVLCQCVPGVMDVCNKPVLFDTDRARDYSRELLSWW